MPTSSPPIPYGWSDFALMRRERSLYVDKTRFLRELENERFAFLIRPRSARGGSASPAGCLFSSTTMTAGARHTLMRCSLARTSEEHPPPTVAESQLQGCLTDERLGVCAVGIQGCKSASARPFEHLTLFDSISSNIARHCPQSIVQRDGGIEFSLAQLPTAQAPSAAIPDGAFHRDCNRLSWLGDDSL